MEKTKTAVDYLLDALKHHGKRIPNPIAEKAKKMEKEQSINDFKAGADSHESMMAVDFNERPETYYNETYGNENT